MRCLRNIGNRVVGGELEKEGRGVWRVNEKVRVVERDGLRAALQGVLYTFWRSWRERLGISVPRARHVYKALIVGRGRKYNFLINIFHAYYH